MTALLLKQRKPIEKKAIDIEGLLLQKFDELLRAEGVELSPDQKEGVIKAMRVANKIGYTNGFKKGAMK